MSWLRHCPSVRHPNTCSSTHKLAHLLFLLMPKLLLHPLSVSSRTVHIPGAHTCTRAHKISHTPPSLSETVKTRAHTPPFHRVPIQAAATLPKLLVLLSCHTLGAAAPEPTRLIWTQVGGVTANICEQCCCSRCKSAQETASAAVEYILFSSVKMDTQVWRSLKLQFAGRVFV